MNEIRMLSTSGILGYGFPEASLEAGMALKPHIIGVDGGSVDPGPHYLGSGRPGPDRTGTAHRAGLSRARGDAARRPAMSEMGRRTGLGRNGTVGGEKGGDEVRREGVG